MSMSIIAMLVSLAMMLTGAGAAGAPVEMSRTLTISNVTLNVNDQTVTLDPSVHAGVTTDGESALFDFAVDSEGETLFPVQLKADAAGLTALFAKSGQAVNVPAETLDALAEQMQQMMSAQMESDPQAAQLLTFLKDEYLPAYVGLFELVKDEARMAELQQKAEALFAEKIDRGEGTPDTVEIDGEAHDVTLYHYTIDDAQLFGFADAVYALDPALQSYYDALMKLYSMLPEESGLNGITSLSDVTEKIGMEMQMEIDEALNEAEQIDIMDAVLTFNIPAQVTVADSQTEDAGEMPQLEPVVVNLHASQYGELTASNFDMDYTVENVRIAMAGYEEKTGDAAYEMNMSMDVQENGEAMANMVMQASSQTDADTGDVKSDATVTVTAKGATVVFIAEGAKGADGANSTNATLMANAGDKGNVSMTATVDEQADGSEDATVALSVSASGMNGSLLVEAETAADGTGDGRVTLAVSQGENTASVNFDVAVTDAAPTDASEGAEVTVIDDLSQEGMQALTGDQAFQGKAMQVMGSFMADAQKLMGSQSVADLMGLFTGVQSGVEEGEPVEDAEIADEDVEDEDGEYVIEMDGDDMFDVDYDEDVEDDGVLAFGEPAFTWMPEGWSETDRNVDTAYDMVDVTYEDESGEGNMYAMFYANPETGDRYTLGDDGALTPAEGRQIEVSQYDEGAWNVAMDEGGVYAMLYIYSDALTIEDIGKIAAGLTY